MNNWTIDSNGMLVLPEGLTVGGNLFLSYTPITSLPAGLTVGGSLDLRGTQITSLPEGLTVGGNLFLSYTPITTLPAGLTVGGNLDLKGTAITIPDNFAYSDGRRFADYRDIDVPALLTSGGKTVKEIVDSGAWECHSWDNCPMRVALGIGDDFEAPEHLQDQVRTFIQRFDANNLPVPNEAHYDN